MSILRQFTYKPLLIAGLICIPFLIGAQANKKGKSAAKAGAPAAPVSDTDFKAMGAPMPNLRVVYPGKAEYSTENLKNDANLFLMLFNPTCEHCEDMTISIEKNLDLFKKSHVLLVAAPTMGPYLEFFENGTRIKNYPQIKYGLDSSDIINRIFIYEMLPQINVYNADRKLIKTFHSIEDIDSLKPYIQ